MIKLENLREETESALYGLTADDSLKYRILQKAAQTPIEEKKRIFRPFPVLCSVLAVLLLLTVALNQVRPLSTVEAGDITVFAAGRKEEGSTSVFSNISASDIVSMDVLFWNNRYQYSNWQRAKTISYQSYKYRKH